MKRRVDVLLGVGIAYLLFLAVLALLGPSFRHDYLAQEAAPNQPSSAQYWLGTDPLGRDILARIAYGARISLFVSFTVQIMSLVVGIVVGVVGAFAKPWIAGPLMRFTDAMFAFPDILLAVLIIGTLGHGANSVFGLPESWTQSTGFRDVANALPVIVALSVTAWPAFARLVKTQLASLKDREFVVAAKATGASTSYLVVKHLLPQLWGILLAVSMVELAGTILAESTLSYLGIGVQAPTPSWGQMILNGRLNMNSYPTELLWPCLVLGLTIFALNFVGDGLRRLTDPQASQ